MQYCLGPVVNEIIHVTPWGSQKTWWYLQVWELGRRGTTGLHLLIHGTMSCQGMSWGARLLYFVWHHAENFLHLPFLFLVVHKGIFSCIWFYLKWKNIKLSYKEDITWLHKIVKIILFLPQPGSALIEILWILTFNYLTICY